MESLAVALAVERARLANNNVIPAALDTLVPTYLPTLPRDLFDNQPLRFKKLSPGYVIYSIGADGVDDGGRERVNSNIKTNYDVTFAVER